MTSLEFRRELKMYRDTFTSHLHFNAESPVRMQGDINRAIEFLNSIKTEGTAQERIKSSIEYLNQASRSAKVFGSTMKIDPKGYDLEVTHENPSHWYQRVIGTAESAMDVIIGYLEGDE